MTVSELLEMLHNEVDDDSITLDQALFWFNTCSEEIASHARKRQTARAHLPPGTKMERVSLPLNFVELIELRYAPDDDTDPQPLLDLERYTHRRQGYQRWGNTIILIPEREGGVLELDYFRKLEPLQNEDDEPEIPTQFHMIYVYYAAIRYWTSWDAGDASDAQFRAEQRYRERLAALDLHTSSEGKYSPYKMRDVLPRFARHRRPREEPWDAYF